MTQEERIENIKKEMGYLEASIIDEKENLIYKNQSDYTLSAWEISCSQLERSKDFVEGGKQLLFFLKVLSHKKEKKTNNKIIKTAKD